MLLKLVMRYEGDAVWTVSAGTIIKWHKSEGERVDYDDDLFDVLVDEVTHTARHRRSHEQRASIMPRPSGFADLAASELRAHQAELMPADVSTASADGDTPQTRRVPRFLIRVSSSDRGTIRRIYVREGDYVPSGQLVALLSTEASKSFDDRDQAVREAPEFHIVANAFHSKLQSVAHAGVAVDKASRGRPEGSDAGRYHFIFWSEAAHETRIGISTYGGFSTSAIFACVPLIQPVLKGRCCIRVGEPIGNCRSDLILQTLEDLPQQWLQPVVDRLELGANYFQPQLCEPSFTVSTVDGPKQFPKTMIVLSALLDAEQVLYRHREHGFLVDPGDWWYALEREEDPSPASIEKACWFRENFESVGRMRVEEFMENFGTLIRLLRVRTHAQVLVFNTPTVSPGRPRHSYQFVKEPRAVRRLEFNLALTELSRRLDFPIVDVDRILKRAGNRSQVNWSEMDPRLYTCIADEAFGIMNELGIFQ